ncbi:MAG: cytochrome b5 [Bernardetiaceae bacterium]|nr:cytochrome b5 [Bernardetiaceae bacterium]
MPIEQNKTQNSKLPTYTKNQLALRNGQDRPEIWCACEGIIYDVTHSRLWKNGKHYQHWAGQDLSKELADAPHTKSVFEKFEKVGRLI